MAPHAIGISEVTEVPNEAAGGFGDERFHELYVALHRRAQNLMRSERANTLQPTALVHEAWVRVLVKRPELAEQRQDFLAYAARAMRSILIDSLRRRKRRFALVLGEVLEDEQGHPLVDCFADRTVDVLDLDTALHELASFDERMARAVELIYFGGLEVDAAAQLLGMARRTFERDLSSARAWLFRRLS
ncbi:MAG: sigma-70 family RNA polymerase sigma factor [Planctomycetes bacterium]|nr:sigma-70 family RNA polymerase sigma factor [Planctomycetota bacterium]